jgi:hypothetical protein
MLVLMTFAIRKSEDTLLKGFWRADSDFCEQAELELFVVYLGDDVGYIRHCRNGYLLAANKNGIILNNPIRLTIGGNINLTPYLAGQKNYNASIDWQDTPPDDADAFPSEFELAYYPQSGKIVMHKDNQVLASLWKDCQMSSLAANASLIPDCVTTKTQYDDL